MRRIRDNIANDNHASGGKDFEICQERLKETNQIMNWEEVRIQRIDLLRDPKSNKVNALKAMVQVDYQILQLTVSTGKPCLS